MALSIFIITTLICLVDGKAAKESDFTPDGDGLHPYVNGMNPGMALRLEQ
jgi:hypothetical protein